MANPNPSLSRIKWVFTQDPIDMRTSREYPEYPLIARYFSKFYILNQLRKEDRAHDSAIQDAFSAPLDCMKSSGRILP